MYTVLRTTSKSDIKCKYPSEVIVNAMASYQLLITFVLIMVRPPAKNKDTVPNFIVIQKNVHIFGSSKA